MATNKRLIKSNDEGGGGGFPAFNTVLYNGTFDPESITGFGFDPDLVWIKNRTNAASNILFDRVRGARYPLFSNTTDSEVEQPLNAQNFITDGFYVSGNWILTDANANNYVAWGWKAGGAAVTNTDGSITSQVSANTEAGFSVVTWSGIGVSQSIGHGLNAVPSIIIQKRRGVGDWEVYTSTTGANQKLILNSTNAASSSGAFGNTTPTSSVYYAGAYADPMIAYCFAEVAGFSKFGSYVGELNSKFVQTDFTPMFVLIKRTDSSVANWLIFDSVRGASKQLNPDLSNAEYDWGATPQIQFDLNGFTLTTNNAYLNGVGGQFIYMAFANQF